MSKRERIEALEARVAALEASNSPGGRDDEACEAPEWRALVDETSGQRAVHGVLAEVLACLHSLAALANAHDDETEAARWNLARVIAVAEGQVGDGWKADPGRVPHGHWGITWLLAMLSHEPPNWPEVADRAAAWLRDITTDGAS